MLRKVSVRVAAVALAAGSLAMIPLLVAVVGGDQGRLHQAGGGQAGKPRLRQHGLHHGQVPGVRVLGVSRRQGHVDNNHQGQ